MRILLISMPDAIPLFSAFQSNVPHLGISSLAANAAMHGCKIKTLNLAFHQKNVFRAVREAIAGFRPNLVGLSAMSFQYKTATKIAGLVHALEPDIKLAIGGYHATLMYNELSQAQGIFPFDFIIRGEGELTFKALAIELMSGGDRFDKIDGLSFRNGNILVHNPPRKLARPEEIELPDRASELLKRGHGFYGKVEVVETSRGCLMDCHFCSIAKMYGRVYRAFHIERVIEDLKRARYHKAVRVMFSDDNLTLNTERLERLCERIVDGGLDDIWYGAEVSCKGIASNHRLAKKMRAANFGAVFLGIENISRKNLLELGKGDIREAALHAIRLLKENDIAIMGGFIVGNPADDKKSIKEVFEFSKDVGVDFIMTQTLTPYPKTRIRDKLLELGLVKNKDDYSAYNGYGCNVRTSALSSNQLRRLVVWENIKWFTTEIFNQRNWFASTKRIQKSTYLATLIMALGLLLRFLAGGFAKSCHRLR